LIISTALAVGHWLNASGSPARFVEFRLAHQFPTWQFLLAINALLLVLGCFLEVTATLLLVLPILAPALRPIAAAPMGASIRGILPFLIILLIILAAITYLPDLTLWLPGAIFAA
jgi:C4-dicarboxylate transporter DctM subunit